MTFDETDRPIDPQVRIGHVHLKVADPERSLQFYRGVPGFRITQRLIAAGIPLDGASDHGVSEALYLRDPDEDRVELSRDRPPDSWPRTPGVELAMFTRRLDLDGLLNEVEAEASTLEVEEGPGDL